MSCTKVAGGAATCGAAAGSLPVTGSPVFTIVVAGIALVVTGILMIRASRFNRSTFNRSTFNRTAA